MNASTRALKGISLVWWPTLLQHLPTADLESAETDTIGDDTDSFTTALHNLACALRLAEVGDLEEITLP
jgi:hypothetical protein